MTKLSKNFTIGGAFARTWWISLIIDVILLLCSTFSGYFYAQWTGIFSALSGWILAICFSEINSLITMLLDKLGVKSSSYMIAMLQLWGLKILFVVVLGTVLLMFVPQNNSVFCFTLVFSVMICTIKNTIISARARIL